MKNVLLYGGGTQSTGLLLMILDGVIDVKIDDAIYSDTFSEPKFVDNYILKVKDYVYKKYGFIINIVNKPGQGLEYDIKNNTGERIASLPLFTANGGMIRRQCTMEYKIIPINKYIKQKYEVGRKIKKSIPLINRLFGISLDEIERCKQSTDWWAINDYPLVMARMYRHEVINYIAKNHPQLSHPPKSSCVFCPFHNDQYWRELKKKHHIEFERACNIDELIRNNSKLSNRCYLHKSMIPLRNVNFELKQINIFGECEGYCGI